MAEHEEGFSSGPSFDSDTSGAKHLSSGVLVSYLKIEGIGLSLLRPS